jgi:hypothetical protein
MVQYFREILVVYMVGLNMFWGNDWLISSKANGYDIVLAKSDVVH